jgi:tRNA(fMet)-specific endonuclease VapC
MPFLLDTNTVSDVVRHPFGRVAARIAQVGEENVVTSIIVAAELRYGATKKNSPKLWAQLQTVLNEIEILPFESPADERYAELRLRLERLGRPIGANDMLIAAHAVALGCTLVTDNEREFSRIKQLSIENWLR